MRDINDEERPMRDQNTGEDLAETIRQAELGAGLELAVRMDRVHIDALALMTDQVEMILKAWGDDPETKGQAVSIHALSILSTFATLRNSASQCALVHANERSFGRWSKALSEFEDGITEAHMNFLAKGGA